MQVIINSNDACRAASDGGFRGAGARGRRWRCRVAVMICLQSAGRRRSCIRQGREGELADSSSTRGTEDEPTPYDLDALHEFGDFERTALHRMCLDGYAAFQLMSASRSARLYRPAPTDSVARQARPNHPASIHSKGRARVDPALFLRSSEGEAHARREVAAHDVVSGHDRRHLAGAGRGHDARIAVEEVAD